MSYVLTAVYSHPKETWSQQKQFLHERVVPMTKSQPGFVTGHWSYDSAESRSYGHVVFETEKDARALETFLHEEAKRPNPLGVAPVSIHVSETMAEAKRA